MARLTECCLSSDDELSDLKAQLRKSSTGVTKGSKPTTKTEAESLAPKVTSRPGVRRVRKLGEPSQATTNPLFQRWSSKVPEKSQNDTEVKKKEPHCSIGQVPEPTSSNSSPSHSESDEDEPQRHVRKPQWRRQRQRVIEDSEDDSNEASSSEEETLLTRVRNLQRNKSGTVTRSKQKTGQQTSNKSVKGDSKALEFSGALASSSETEATQNDEADDPSIYKTAEEDSSDFSDDPTFNSAFDELPLPSSRKLRLKVVAPRGRKISQPKRTSEEILPLTSKISGQRKISAASREDDLTSKKETTSKKRTPQGRNPSKEHKKDESSKASIIKATSSELADTFSKLRLQLQDFSDEDETPSKPEQLTTPSTPPKTTGAKGLTSPSKQTLIPQTPHHPSTDDFWSQDLVNEWNDLHSPRKLILPPVVKSPTKVSPKKAPKKETKKAFDARKHTLAESFLVELDREITQGKVAELAKSTGGVKLVWTKTLNTTAGRASWRRETIRTRSADGMQVSVEYKHHSSIELAEKVIDDEHRLLNVLAHEFCHLANFMVSGVTTNPHGKEFKTWAAKCSRAFGDRGIEVTTKHSYDIDFKYVWACEECGTEFKRHSKSIDPQRHRCGSCKGMLKQTKPVPRGKSASGAAPKGPTRYQVFVKEQMAVVREENPGSPQKEVMRLIAKKWTKQGGKEGKTGVDKMVSQMVDLTLED